MKHENKKAPIGAFLFAPLMHSCSGLVMQNHSGVDRAAYSMAKLRVTATMPPFDSEARADGTLESACSTSVVVMLTIWPGDVLTVSSEIEEIVPSRSRRDRGMVRVRSETLNQRGETVQRLVARIVVPCRNAGD